MIEWLAIGVTSGVIGGVATYARHYRNQQKKTAEYLKAVRKERVLLDHDLDELLEIKDKALLLVGSFGGSDRSYAGDTLEMAQKVEGLMDENFRKSSELSDGLDEVEKLILNDGNKVLSKEDAERVEWISEHDSLAYKNFSRLKSKGEEDRAVLVTDLAYLENLLETLWVQLDEQDKRFKSILLRQVDLVKRSSSGRFQLKALSRSWVSQTEVLLDNAFSISKSDPVRVDQSLLGHLVKRFDKAEAALTVAEKLIEIENNEVTDLRQRMDAMNLEELWIDGRLDDLDARLRELVGYSGSVQKIEREIGSVSFIERLYEVDFLLKKYETHHRHLNEKFDRSLGKVRKQIAEHLGLNEGDVLRDSEEVNQCKMDAREVLADLGEGIAAGNVERAKSLNDQVKDKLAIAHDVLATARKSAIEGEERVRLLRNNLNLAQKSVEGAVARHEVLLGNVSRAVFDDNYLDVVDGAQHQLDVLDTQLDLIERYRAEGKFIATEKILNSADMTLLDLNSIPERVADSEREIQKLESDIEEMLGRMNPRLMECSEQMGEAYLCEDTKQMMASAVSSHASFIELNKRSGGARNVLEIMHRCHQLDDLLEVVSLGIASDAEMFEILNQKVEQIDALVEEALSNAKKAATDGIPDSRLTTQMLEKVAFLTQGWPTLKARMEREQQGWKELRFDFDVYLQGLETVNLQLEDELKYAQQTLDTLEGASEALNKLSAWKGERGYLAETRVANQLLHQAFQMLSLGKYNEAVHLAQQTRDEMRDSLHHARGKERVAELRNARTQSRVAGRGLARESRFIEWNPIQRKGDY